MLVNYSWANAEQTVLNAFDEKGNFVSMTINSPLYTEFLSSGAVATPYSVPPKTWDTIRAKRDQLIRESDWTMISDASVDQAQWASYRQILRDLPQTYTNPEDVVWPTMPSTAGPNTDLE